MRSYKMLFGKAERRRPLSSWVDNIKMDLRLCKLFQPANIFIFPSGSLTSALLPDAY
jgi:hypothetical protein